MKANKIAGASAGALRLIDKTWNKKRKKGNK
jgi:hypothetical protein